MVRESGGQEVGFRQVLLHVEAMLTQMSKDNHTLLLSMKRLENNFLSLSNTVKQGSKELAPIREDGLHVPSEDRRMPAVDTLAFPDVNSVNNMASINDVNHEQSNGTVGGESAHLGTMAIFSHDNWPGSVLPRPVAEPYHGHSEIATLEHSRGSRRTTSSLDLPADARKAWYIFSPRDPGLIAYSVFDFFGLMILAYDLTIVPYLLAWQVQLASFTLFYVLAYISASFWTFDVCMSCFRGYYQDGDAVLDQSKIIKRYLRSWCLPDLILVSADWLGLTGEAAGSYKLLRFAKIAKVVRMLGLFKVVRVLKLVKFASPTEGSSALLDSATLGAKFMFLAVSTLWANHIICCLWYTIGSMAPSDTGGRWLDALVTIEGEVMNYFEVSHAFQYATALHWAIAQCTLGAMEISPSNSMERTFTVLCLIFGLVVGSTMISALSASMVDMQMMQRERRKQMRALSRYLEENEVRSSVAFKVQQQVRERLRERSRLTKDEIPCLELLSSALKDDLHTEICRPHLQVHQLFQMVNYANPVIYRQLSCSAVEITYPRSGDDIYFAGTPAECAYVTVSGRLAFEDVTGSPEVEDRKDEFIDPGKWICEGALWCQWIHTGNLKATTDAQLLEIDANAMHNALSNRKRISRIVAAYAEVFHKRVVTAKPPAAKFPTDLEVPFTEFGDVARMMPREAREHLATIALEMLQGATGNSWTFGRQFSTTEHGALLEEVKKGVSVIVMSRVGEVERVVSVAVLKLHDSHGRVLVQIGKWKESGSQPDCQLPAVKQKEGEEVEDAFKRLLDKKLHVPLSTVRLQQVSQEVATKRSDRFGVASRYLRQVCSAGLIGELELDYTAPPQIVPELVDKKASPMQELWERKVYFSASDDEDRLYAWLHMFEFEYLTGSQKGAAELRAWVEAVSPQRRIV